MIGGIEHKKTYTLGDVIGYLIYVKDEENFIDSFPGVEYVTFDFVVGKQYKDKYDRIPVYEINEYNDRSVVSIYSITNTYIQKNN